MTEWHHQMSSIHTVSGSGAAIDQFYEKLIKKYNGPRSMHKSRLKVFRTQINDLSIFFSDQNLFIFSPKNVPLTSEGLAGLRYVKY